MVPLGVGKYIVNNFINNIYDNDKIVYKTMY